jgi:DNA-binding MarR family transcriptional regulator
MPEDDLDRLAAALERTASWMRRTGRPGEWNAVALSTLDRLDRGGPARISDLTAHEHISQPGMTGIIARLESAGYVTRGADPDDGRATLVTLTEAGRAYLHEFHTGRAVSIATHLRCLNSADLAALRTATGALERLAGLPITGED